MKTLAKVTQSARARAPGGPRLLLSCEAKPQSPKMESDVGWKSILLRMLLRAQEREGGDREAETEIERESETLSSCLFHRAQRDHGMGRSVSLRISGHF